LGGLGNVHDNWLNLPGGAYRAVSPSSFRFSTQRWAIGWLDARHPHQLDVPVTSGFENGIGSFYASDTLNGQPVRVRFMWLDTATHSPRWEQAFSADGGQSWEVNSRMTFVRAASAA
jgi:hypothetical protein